VLIQPLSRYGNRLGRIHTHRRMLMYFCCYCVTHTFVADVAFWHTISKVRFGGNARYPNLRSFLHPCRLFCDRHPECLFDTPVKASA